MYFKAKHFKDEKIAELIKKSTHPQRAKNLGRQVANFNSEEWDKVSMRYMFLAVYKKFSQSEYLRNRLLEHKNKIFVEGSPYDKIWGVGLHYTEDRILNPSNWKGENKLGRVLNFVINELERNEHF